MTKGDGHDVGARRRGHRWARIFAIAAASVVAGAVLALLVTNLVVTRSVESVGYDDVAAVPVRPVAIVFGAGVVDGKPTPALAERVHGAVELYKQGKVGRVLMSGDHSTLAYDEVSVMKQQAVAEGVPADAITRDHAGFNTYDSCYRARDIFGVRAAVLVTQDYHLSRALFTCRELGIDAVGLRISDWQHAPEKAQSHWWTRDISASYMSREWLSRTKAVIAAKATHPQPKFLGPYEGLRET
jgi:vancomycin permeability regulator SanA